MRALAAGLARALVLAVMPSVAFHVYDARFYDGIGADIGGGLVVFQVLVLGAFLWSWVDAGRRTVRDAIVIWVWAGVASFTAGAVEWTIIGDLGGVGPTMGSGLWSLVLLAAGAAGGLTTGWVLKRRTKR